MRDRQSCPFDDQSGRIFHLRLNRLRVQEERTVDSGQWEVESGESVNWTKKGEKKRKRPQPTIQGRQTNKISCWRHGTGRVRERSMVIEELRSCERVGDVHGYELAVLEARK